MMWSLRLRRDPTDPSNVCRCIARCLRGHVSEGFQQTQGEKNGPICCCCCCCCSTTVDQWTDAPFLRSRDVQAGFMSKWNPHGQYMQLLSPSLFPLCLSPLSQSAHSDAALKAGSTHGFIIIFNAHTPRFTHATSSGARPSRSPLHFSRTVLRLLRDHFRLLPV